MTTHVSWLGRTFGWSGNRSQWLTLMATLLWLGGFAAIVYLSQDWSIGTSVAAFVVWLGVFAVVARESLRDLFGPVFFYDLLRVSRNRFTFGLRGGYVICLGAFLLLMYFDWILTLSNSNSTIVAQMFALAGTIAVACSVTLSWATRNKLHIALRGPVVALGLLLGVILLMAAVQQYLEHPSSRSTIESLPSSVVSRFATQFFQYFVVVQWIVLTLLTPVYVAGTIAVEKERKTLEFLLATDLRNREIVFGKLASRVLTLVMYMLAGLPLIAFLQLFGGIDPEQLIAAMTATFFTVLGLASLSIWVSTTLKKARDAIVITYLLILVYGFVSFMLAVLTSAAIAVGWWNAPVTILGVSLSVHGLLSFLADGNPFWSFFNLSPIRGNSMSNVLRDFVLFWTLAIVVFLGSAILRIRRVTIAQAYGPQMSPRTKSRAHPKAQTEDGPDSLPKKARTHNPLVRLFDGSGDRPPIAGNPVAWKEIFVDATFRGGCLGRIIGIVILLLTFLPLGLIFYYEFIDVTNYRASSVWSYRWYRFSEEVNAWVRVVTGVLGFLMFMAAALRGAGAITGEKDRDSWISLLSTPLTAEEILWGKWWGCVMSLRRALFVLLIVWAIGIALGAVMPVMMLVMLPLTLIYVSAFSWVGLYCSMTSRNSLVASVRAFFAALFCAGGFWLFIFLCCFTPLSMGRSSNWRTTEQMGSFFLGFTPPMVYGVFPLGDFNERDQLGPFRRDRDYSAGLSGPIIGTTFWILFNFAMHALCLAKCRNITNRADRRPGRPVRDRSDNRENEEPDEDDRSSSDS